MEENNRPIEQQPSQASTSEQTPPTQSTPPSSLKLPFKPPLFVFVLLGLLLLAATAGASYFLVMQPKPASEEERQVTETVSSPTPPPAEQPAINTNVYTDLNFGYSFEFPSTWVKETKPECFGSYLYPKSSPESDAGAECRTSNAVVTYVISDQVAIDSWKQRREQGYVGQLSKVLINGFEAEKEINGPTPGTFVYISKDEKIYVISLLENSTLISQDDFNQILSTFKFTDPNKHLGDQNTIKSLIAKRTNISIDNLALTYDSGTNFEGGFASGTFYHKNIVGGGKWVAALQNGGWIIVWSGNGSPKCTEIAAYTFPDGFINCD